MEKKLKEFIYTEQFKNKIPVPIYIFNKKILILIVLFIYLTFQPRNLFLNIIYAGIFIYIIYDYINNSYLKKDFLNENSDNVLIKIISIVKNKYYKKREK